MSLLRAICVYFRALAAFLLWSVGLQALLALHQLLLVSPASRGQQQQWDRGGLRLLQLDRLGVQGLILTTNNTGEGEEGRVSRDV